MTVSAAKHSELNPKALAGPELVVAIHAAQYELGTHRGELRDESRQVYMVRDDSDDSDNSSRG